MRFLSALTLFLSAALLFLIQPMIAKMILPLLGGSPAVWITCMVFFQTTLLGGYLYAHAAARLKVRSQAILHLGLLLLALCALPLLTLPLRLLHGDASSTGADPATWLGTAPVEASHIPWLLGLLLLSVGLPSFVVGASSPLLQKWFAYSGAAAGRDPYFLYSASNLGSMVALLGYPILVEPWIRLAHQGWLWAAGYGLLVLLTAACAVPTLRAVPTEAGTPAVGVPPSGGLRSPAASATAVTSLRRLHWTTLAFIPAALLFGVTTYLSTDLAAVPLLWVIPLALYLLTFILAFSRIRWPLHWWAAAFLPPLLLLHLVVLFLHVPVPIAPLILLHLLTFFLAALACHGALAEDRPPISHLTEFYLWLSLGGVLGGLFASLGAPLLFSSIAEYPWAILLACFFGPRVRWFNRDPATPMGPIRPMRSTRRVLLEPRKRSLIKSPDLLPLGIRGGNVGIPLIGGLAATALLLGLLAIIAGHGWFWIPFALSLPCAAYALVFLLTDRPMLFGVGISALMLFAMTGADFGETIEQQERDFFGVLRVTVSPDRRFRLLRHGSTVHGEQWLDGGPERRREPIGYYHRQGPIGQVFAAFSGNSAKHRIGLVGLGVGSLAAYGEPGQELTFYELNPRVRDLARGERFTFLRDCRAHVDVVLGDARLCLARAPEGQYDLLVLDAFSSDAIPIHLLTREALRDVYLAKLADHGLLAYHISNRYLDLRPVLGNLARDAGLACRVQVDDGDEPSGRAPSTWVIMARTEADLGPLADDPRWQPLPADAAPVWTDDYSNLFHVFKWW